MLFRLLQLYVFLLPFEGLWQALLGIDTPLKPYRIVGLLIMAVAMVRLLASRYRLRLDPFDRGYLVILAYGLSMAIFWYLVNDAGSIGWALWDSTLVLFGLIVAIVLKNELISWRRAEILLTSFQWATVLSLVLFLLLGNRFQTDRLEGFYDNPNSYAVALGASLVISIAKILFPRRGARRMDYIFNGGSILALAFAMLFTGSRGPIGAMAFSLLAFAVPLWKRSGRKGRLVQRVMLLLPVIVGGAMLVNNTYEEQKGAVSTLTRYESESTETGSGRWDIWRSALLVAQDHYYVGVGTAQYRYYHRAYTRRLDTLYSPNVAEVDLGTHSEYINFITSFGIFGILLYLMIIRFMYRKLMQQLSKQADASFVLAASFPLLLLVLVTQIVHITMLSPQFYFLMALIMTSAIPRHAHPSNGQEL